MADPPIEVADIGGALPPRKRQREVNCKACGRDDHKRSSSKLCPNYVPRAKNAAKPQDNMGIPVAEAQVAVPIGLNVFCKIDAVKHEISDLVSRCTDLKVETCRLLLSFVLNHLVYNPDTPMPDIRFGANGQMRNFFSSLIANPRRRDLLNRNTCNWAALNEFIEAHYVPRRPADLFWCDMRGYSNMVTALASAHNDDCARHISTNLPSRLKQWLRHKFRKHLGFCLEEDDVCTLAVYVLALIDPPEDIEEMPPYPAEIIDNCGDGELVVYYMDYYETRARQYILCNLPMDKASLQNNWHLYLKSMWRILRTFENNHQMYEEEYLLNNEGPLLNVYALLPLNGFTQKHILITSNVLKEICVAANLPDVRQMDVHALWSQCFKLNKVSTTGNQRRRFGYSITSDGVGCSASVLRPAYPAPPASRYGFAFDGTGYQPLDVNNETRVIGIDVNRGVLLAASCGLDDRIADVPTDQTPFADGTHELVYTTARWREENGEKFGEKKKAEWNEIAPEVVNAMAQIPSAKSTSFLGIIQHLQYVLQHRDAFTGFYRPEMWRKLRRKLFSKRQRAYDNLARMLTLRQDGQFDHNTIIAYGAGNFDTASPGYPATPNKRLFYELKKRCRVRLVPEYRTSQRCSNCEFELGQSRVWRIKHCSNNNCLAIWHRDVNAARNIRYIFLARNRDGGERPVPFRYDPPRPQQ
ncbi:hypothetical protein MP228_002407 [Amoeboaphelidium protococcarum]|nr:hypothetical protein MP228_002407 [Amoeboaphelidium protococcarum]